MERASLFERRLKTTITVVLLVIAVVLLGGLEVGLRLFAPMAIGTAGYVRSQNGLVYGWGFDPQQMVRVEDPDTGEVYLDRVNSRGWRDRERTFDNPSGTFRVLVMGDSNAFGYIVPGRALYNRVLEDRLRAEGYNAEVLIMGNAGWGTDQALEAFKREGQRYRPDLVVLHFSETDIHDNVYYRDPGKFGRRKPFYYEIDDSGALVRRVNERFKETRGRIKRQYVIAQSEILKRLWVLRTAFKHRGKPAYVFGNNQSIQLRFLLGKDGAKRLFGALGTAAKAGFDLAALEAAIDAAGLGEHRTAITRIAENRHFHEHWFPPYYHQQHNDYDGAEWRLYFALVEAIQEVAESNGARLAILSDNDIGHYDWDLAWHRIAPGEEAKARFLGVTARLAAFAAERGIGMVKTVSPMTRARNDAHPNIAGNAAIAENLYRYLMAHHGEALAARRAAAKQGARGS